MEIADLQYIAESPQFVGGFSINRKQASDMYFDFKSKKKSVLLQYVSANGSLYRNGNKFFVMDSDLKRVTYYMQFEERMIKGRKAAYQSLVWRDVDAVYTQFLPIDVVFKYLLPINNLVVTDRKQTELGARLWRVIIGRAIHDGINVYHVNLNEPKSNFIPISSAHDLDENPADIWGVEQRHQANLIVLSKDVISKKIREEIDSFGMPVIPE